MGAPEQPPASEPPRPLLARAANLLVGPPDPRESRGLRFARGAFTLHLWTLFGIAGSNIALGLSVLGTARVRRQVARHVRRLRPIAWPLALYVAATLLAVAASLQPRASLRELAELFSLGTLVLAPLLIVGWTAVRRVVDGLLVVVGGCALLGLGQFLLGYGGLEQRIRGPFSHYMTFAGVVLLADCLLIARLVTRDGRERRWLWWGLLVVYNTALLGSLTRSSWVAFALTLTVLLALRAPRLLLAYLPAAALFLFLAPAPLLSRVVSIADLQDPSNYDRISMVEAGAHMIAQRPVTGLGPDMVEQYYPLYRHPTAPRLRRPHLHNSFLQLAAERGLPALAAYLWLMVAVLVQALRRYRWLERDGGPGAELLLGVALALVAFNCAGLFEDNWSDTEVQRFILFLMAVPFCLPGPDEEPARGAPS